MTIAMCEKCSGLKLPAGPHVCDPGDVELTTAMRNEKKLREGNAKISGLLAAVHLLEGQGIRSRKPDWKRGYKAAIANLKHEADALRAGLPKEKP